MKPTLNPTKRQTGSAVVELAVMMPFLLLTLLTIIDLGLLIRNHQVLQNAAREGARYSVQPKQWMDNRNPDGAGAEARIKGRIVDYCTQEGLTVSPADVSIDQNYPIDVGGGITAMSTRITVTHQHSFITPGATNLTGGPVSLVGEAVFRNLF